MSALPCFDHQLPATFMPSPGSGPLARKVEQTMRAAMAGLAGYQPPPAPFDALPPNIGRELSRKWPEPCERAFEYLLRHHPAALLTWVQSGRLDAADLTFAAEIAGRATDSPSVRRVLAPLLAHREAVVREGAIYGLGRHIDGLAVHLDVEIQGRLRELVATDPSAAVREAAQDAIGRG